jgi:hypothetical protein
MCIGNIRKGIPIWPKDSPRVCEVIIVRIRSSHRIDIYASSIGAIKRYKSDTRFKNDVRHTVAHRKDCGLNHTTRAAISDCQFELVFTLNIRDEAHRVEQEIGIVILQREKV